MSKTNKEQADIYKAYFEKTVQLEAEQWFENSKKLLDHTHFSEGELAEVHEELEKRQTALDDFKKAPLPSPADFSQLEGTYSIIGLNQNEAQSSYMGFLHLQLKDNNRIQAEWVIDGEQTQKGEGFFKNNVLIINFSYEGELDHANKAKIYKGVVVYKVLNKNMLNGFWSEKHGDDAFLGFEGGRKLELSETISYQAQFN